MSDKRRKNGKTEKTALAALLSALAILLGYVEYLIPVVPPIAGIRLGLGNIAVLAALYLLESVPVASAIMLTKVTLCAVLFSGVGGFAYSLAGGACSVAVMAIGCRVRSLSAAGISSLGGAAHIAAQVGVAAFAVSSAEVLTLLPVLIAVGTLTGFLNGVILNMAEVPIRKYFRSIGMNDRL